MKKKSIKKKLFTNKVTIADLSDKEQNVIRGGDTLQGRTCEGTVHGRTCDGLTEEACQTGG